MTRQGATGTLVKRHGELDRLRPLVAAAVLAPVLAEFLAVLRIRPANWCCID